MGQYALSLGVAVPLFTSNMKSCFYSAKYNHMSRLSFHLQFTNVTIT